MDYLEILKKKNRLHKLSTLYWRLTSILSNSKLGYLSQILIFFSSWKRSVQNTSMQTLYFCFKTLEEGNYTNLLPIFQCNLKTLYVSKLPHFAYFGLQNIRFTIHLWHLCKVSHWLLGRKCLYNFLPNIED